MARFASNIRFYCPECGYENEDTISVPETYWVGDNADERMTEDSTDTGCDACGKAFALHVQNSDCRIFATMYDHDDTKVIAGDAYMTEPDEEDFSYLFDVPSDPARLLEQTLNDTWNVLESARMIAESETLYRMVFIQQYAALEAYLGDTLINEVTDDAEALSKLVEGEKDLKERKYPLSVILANPQLVKREVVKHLRDQLYHNFRKVEVVWKMCLSFDLFPEHNLRTRMMKSMAVRHDCVHRNGKDKENNARTEVVWDYLSQIDSDIRAMMRHIEAEISKRSNSGA